MRIKEERGDPDGYVIPNARTFDDSLIGSFGEETSAEVSDHACGDCSVQVRQRSLLREAKHRNLKPVKHPDGRDGLLDLEHRMQSCAGVGLEIGRRECTEVLAPPPLDGGRTTRKGLAANEGFLWWCRCDTKLSL